MDAAREAAGARLSPSKGGKPGRTLEQRRTLLTPDGALLAARALGPEPEACPACAQAAPGVLFERQHKRYWRCGTCALVWIHDIYPEFATDVEHLDAEYALDRRVELSPGERRAAQRRLRRALQPGDKAPGRLLEIGCQQGAFLAQAQALGWEAVGVELLPEAAHLARSERGLDVRTGELAQQAFQAVSFDVVYLSEVIEHIVDPLALMREIQRVLRPGGVALVGTGNACSWVARLRGSRWWYYRFGGHLHIRFFGPASLRALGGRAGFDRVAVRTRGFAFREARELRGRWYKPLAKLGQAVLSPAATAAGAGHRLWAQFHKATAAEAP